MARRHCIHLPGWVALSPVRHTSHGRRNLRSAHPLPGRLLARRPLVSSSPLPPPARPTTPACKRGMTARPCPSLSHPPTLSLTPLIDLSSQARLGRQQRVLPAQRHSGPAYGSHYRPPRQQDGHRRRQRRAERADRRPLRRPQPQWRQRRVPTVVEAVEPWSGGIGHRAGPCARTGEPDGRRMAGSVRGRACDASTVVLLTPTQRKKTHVTDVCMVDSAVDNVTLRG